MMGQTFQRRLKRGLDMIVAGLGLCVCSPLLLAVGVAVWVKMGRPVLFRQLRPGLHGRPFRLYKIRTMTDRRGEDGKLRPDAERLTGLGRFLRRTSLDELPQLWNVFRGDMSLVGPRPLLMEYLARYTPDQRRRHEVPPGLTGWAQVNGRNAISWEEKFEYDVWYVEHGGPTLDLRILLLTLNKILRREGINACGHSTMSEFIGPTTARHDPG